MSNTNTTTIRQRVLDSCLVASTRKEIASSTGLAENQIDYAIKFLRGRGELVVDKILGNKKGGNSYYYMKPRVFVPGKIRTVWRGPTPASWGL